MLLTRLRRLLDHRVSVAALAEAACWLALPYLLVGLVLAFTHPDNVAVIDQQIQARLPQSNGFELVAFGIATLLWPAVLVPPVGCPG